MSIMLKMGASKVLFYTMQTFCCIIVYSDLENVNAIAKNADIVSFLQPSFTLLKICSAGNLLLVFGLAMQLIVEPPGSILVVCAYAICFLYLMATLWIMKSFVDEIRAMDEDVTPALNNTLNSDTVSENFDELNDVADSRSVFRLHQLSKTKGNSSRKF